MSDVIQAAVAGRYVTQATIHAFAMVARPIILEYFSPRSCIASTRIALEAFGAFGIRCRAVPAEFRLSIPDRQLLYLAGVAKADRDRLAKTNELVELQALSGVGWQGHLCALVEERWWVDASFDQAFFAFSDLGKLPPGEPPQILVLDLNSPLGEEFTLDGKGELDDGGDVLFEYLSVSDHSFSETPAWELDHLRPAIRRIVRRMNRFLKGRP